MSFFCSCSSVLIINVKSMSDLDTKVDRFKAASRGKPHREELPTGKMSRQTPRSRWAIRWGEWARAQLHAHPLMLESSPGSPSHSTQKHSPGAKALQLSDQIISPLSGCHKQQPVLTSQKPGSSAQRLSGVENLGLPSQWTYLGTNRWTLVHMHSTTV